MLAVTNVRLELLHVNPAWTSGLGHRTADVAGRELPGLVAEPDRDGARARLRRALEQPAGGDHRFVAADGAQRLLRWRAARDGAVLHVTAVDVTGLVARAEAADAELQTLTATVSHDLRAPLRALDGFSRILLAGDASLPADTLRYLGLVRDAGAELAVLLDGLVEVMRVGREPLERVELDPAALAREVADGLDARLGDGRAVDWAIREVPPCRADRRLLRRVLAELLGNAVKFSRARERPRVEFGWDEDAGAYVVGDDGIGFDEALAGKAFGVLERLHAGAGYEGAGVGLAIVERIVRRHGGRVWARSRPGHGTRVLFCIGDEGED